MTYLGLIALVLWAATFVAFLVAGGSEESPDGPAFTTAFLLLVASALFTIFLGGLS